MVVLMMSGSRSQYGVDARILPQFAKVINNNHDYKMLMGGDVDTYGCRTSAGYRWCNYTNRCEFATYECMHPMDTPPPTIPYHLQLRYLQQHRR